MVESGGLAPGVVIGEVDEALSRLWTGAVYEMVRQERRVGRILSEVHPPGPGWNYYSVRIQFEGDAPIRILLNAGARLVAASHDRDVPTNGPLRFCDVPSAEAFTRLGLDVASAEMLKIPLHPEHTALLTRRELADIAYHNPDTIGDALFNWFD